VHTCISFTTTGMEPEAVSFSPSPHAGLEANQDHHHRTRFQYSKRPFPGSSMNRSDSASLEAVNSNSCTRMETQHRQSPQLLILSEHAMTDPLAERPESTKRCRYSFENPTSSDNMESSPTKKSSPSNWASQVCWSEPPPSLDRKPSPKKTICRICQHPYGVVASIETVARPEPVNGTSRNTLLKYYPFLRNRISEHSSTTMMSGLTTDEDAQHPSSSPGDGAVACHFCEHLDFCPHCPVQECVQCHFAFCFFCRTRNANGEWLCVSCCCESHANRHTDTDMQLE
jgi:hypothetical protein